MADFTIVLTCHKEGRLMHPTFRCISQSIEEAEHNGLTVEWIVVASDSIDNSTRAYLEENLPPRARLHEVNVKDLGAARNSGIEIAQGDYIAIADADDFWGCNWLSATHKFASSHPEKTYVYHPMLAMTFEGTQNIRLVTESDARDFSPSVLLDENLWSALCIAKRQVFIDHPYDTGLSYVTGFAFEDWHFNCETLASGIHHKVVPNTFQCYRVKVWKESLSRNITNNQSLLTPTKLFALAYQKQSSAAE